MTLTINKITIDVRKLIEIEILNDDLYNNEIGTALCKIGDIIIMIYNQFS